MERSVKHGAGIKTQKVLNSFFTVRHEQVGITSSFNIIPAFVHCAILRFCDCAIERLCDCGTLYYEMADHDPGMALARLLWPWLLHWPDVSSGRGDVQVCKRLKTLSGQTSWESLVRERQSHVAHSCLGLDGRDIQSKLFSTIFDYNDILYITIYTPWSKFFWCNITIY